jgi:hypothetical protein
LGSAMAAWKRCGHFFKDRFYGVKLLKPLGTKQGRFGEQKISAIFAVDVVGPVVLKSL